MLLKLQSMDKEFTNPIRCPNAAASFPGVSKTDTPKLINCTL